MLGSIILHGFSYTVFIRGIHNIPKCRKVIQRKKWLINSYSIFRDSGRTMKLPLLFLISLGLIFSPLIEVHGIQSSMQGYYLSPDARQKVLTDLSRNQRHLAIENAKPFLNWHSFLVFLLFCNVGNLTELLTKEKRKNCYRFREKKYSTEAACLFSLQFPLCFLFSPSV